MSLPGYFEFDQRAFWGDHHVKVMTERQVCAYVRLLSSQWENGFIPNDVEEIAMILSEGPRRIDPQDVVGSNSGSMATLLDPLNGSLWHRLKPCFQECLDGRGFVNRRLAEQRESWSKKHKGYVENGKKGAAKRWKQKSYGENSPPNSPPNEPENSQSIALSPSPSPSLSPSPSGEEKNPKKDSSRTTRREAPADVIDDEDIAIWFPMVKGKRKCDEARVRVSPETGDFEEWAVLHSDLAVISGAYPDVEIADELAKMRAWLFAQKTRRKTPSGLNKFINSWLDRAQNQNGRGGSSAAQDSYGQHVPGGARGTNPVADWQDEKLKDM